MFERTKSKNQCRKLNANRNVKEYRSSVAIDQEFFRRISGNSLISGTNDLERARYTAALVKARQSITEAPIIVFSGSPSILNALISMKGQFDLVVVDAEAPCYQFMEGISIETLEDFIRECASMMHFMNAGSIANYISACWQVLICGVSDVNLVKLKSLLEQPIQIIQQYGKRNGAPINAIDTITSDALLKDDALQVLRQINRSFSTITTDYCASGFSLLNECQRQSMDRQLYYIDIRSANQAIMNLYFSIVLDELKARMMVDSIVFYNCPFTSNDRLYEILNRIKRVTGSDIIVSVEEALGSVPGEMTIDKISGFNNISLLINGNENPFSLSELLKSFGSYNHYFPVWIPAQKKWSIQTEIRDRVRTVDTDSYRILIHGHKGNLIELYADVDY